MNFARITRIVNVVAFSLHFLNVPCEELVCCLQHVKFAVLAAVQHNQWMRPNKYFVIKLYINTHNTIKIIHLCRCLDHSRFDFHRSVSFLFPRGGSSRHKRLLFCQLSECTPSPVKSVTLWLVENKCKFMKEVS